MKSKHILLYCTGIDYVLLGSSKVAGIQVQMSFWAKVFYHNSWKVFSFSENAAQTIQGITFLYKKKTWLDKHGLSFIQEFFDCFHALLSSHAQIVIVRGASRSFYVISLLCKLFRARLIYFGASDSDFIPGKEIIAGAGYNIALYRKSIKHIDSIVVQNQIQHDCLYQHYGRESLIIPNIWAANDTNATKAPHKLYDIIWVSNIHKIKRVEWLLQLAKKMPDMRFAIIGGSNFQNYYQSIQKEATKISNIEFLGAQPFNKVSDFIEQSKLLVCTSEFEGFPNTFLQAWSNNVPVVATVNPNNVIKHYNLGRVVNNEDDLLTATQELFDNNQAYRECQENILKYFYEHHDADTAFEKLSQYLHI